MYICRAPEGVPPAFRILEAATMGASTLAAAASGGLLILAVVPNTSGLRVL